MEEKAFFTLPETCSPADLVSAARLGDADAFGELVRGCERTLYRVARTVLRSDADCADAVQEALSKAWLAMRSLREPQYFRTWLTRILLNECYRLARRGRRRDEMREPTIPTADTAERDELIDLKAALAALPDRYRIPVVLYHVEDFSVSEIAAMLRMPAGTVKSRLNRGRAKLLARLIPKEGTR